MQMLNDNPRSAVLYEAHKQFAQAKRLGLYWDWPRAMRFAITKFPASAQVSKPAYRKFVSRSSLWHSSQALTVGVNAEPARTLAARVTKIRSGEDQMAKNRNSIVVYVQLVIDKIHEGKHGETVAVCVADDGKKHKIPASNIVALEQKASCTVGIRGAIAP